MQDLIKKKDGKDVTSDILKSVIDVLLDDEEQKMFFDCFKKGGKKCQLKK